MIIDLFNAGSNSKLDMSRLQKVVVGASSPWQLSPTRVAVASCSRRRACSSPTGTLSMPVSVRRRATGRTRPTAPAA